VPEPDICAELQLPAQFSAVASPPPIPSFTYGTHLPPPPSAVRMRRMHLFDIDGGRRLPWEPDRQHVKLAALRLTVTVPVAGPGDFVR